MPHHKACIPCANSKRKCDRQLPGCERCTKRNTECLYSQRKKRRRDDASQYKPKGSELVPFPSVTIDANDVDVASWNWDILDGFDLVNSLHPNDLAIATIPSLDSTSTLLDWPNENTDNDTIRPWYLQKGTWELQHHSKDPNCGLGVNYDPYILEIRSMLRLWSTTGHNEFIHRNLYESYMPRHIQDAITMLAAYFHCSADMRLIILQIAEDQSCRLIEYETSKTDDGRNTLNHLSRVHALFACVFVRLFDGFVKFRASAEKQVPILRLWISEMIEEVSRIERINPMPNDSITKRGSRVFDAEFYEISEQWNTWLMAESVRRTHVIVNTVLGVYLCLSKSEAECSGFLMVTARRGLWQAKSASLWSHIMSSESPLLVSIANPGHLITEHPASEFDEVLILLWKYMVGSEEIQRWIEKDKKLI